MSFSKQTSTLNRNIYLTMSAIFVFLLFFSCKSENKEAYAIADSKNHAPSDLKANIAQRNLSQEWKDYWYAGKAEITSYKLQQARYGELREGTSALIFVAEDFLPKKQVKADRQNNDNIPVLKLNATKNFTTGIYPYSIMTSTFLPVTKDMHALKISQSMQEWCGNTYTQLNNRKDFEVQVHSYFENKADEEFNVSKAILENELWSLLRIDPTLLPTGEFDIIPGLSFVAMKHAKIQSYKATGTLNAGSYTLTYPELDRELVIHFSESAPFQIEGWEETYPDGRGGKKLTTTATKIATIQSAYWGKNSNADASLRKELGL